MSQDAYIRDMITDPEPNLDLHLSEVASFYDDRNVLLTGGSGFLGRLTLEKILRSCPSVGTIFLLLRGKKGKSPEERFRELFDDVIFDRLKREQPKFARKVMLVDGDMGELGLGLSLEQRKLLRTSHIVIHAAATVRFNENLRIATNINVRGTKELLVLAKEMLNLKAFVHISTAYSNCVHETIEEKFYPPPIDANNLIQLIDILDDAALENLVPQLLGKWPNTYAFTKAVTEDLIRQKSEKLPVCIVRPSIVIATYHEPVAGWINNVYGPTGIGIGAAVGLLHTLYCDKDLIADMIPADYVVNTVIVAAWDISRSRGVITNSANTVMNPECEVPPIYNIVSSPRNPTTWGQLMSISQECGYEIVSIRCLWYYCFTLNKHLWVHNIYVLFLHLLPAIIVDSFARLTGRKPMLWETYKRIHKFSNVIAYFTTQQWRFHDEGVQGLFGKLNHADRLKFNFDVVNLDWKDYYNYQIRGFRVYLLKDPLDTLPEALVRYKKLKVAHYSLVTTLWVIFFWLLWTLLQFIGSSLFPCLR